jgi:hypothetical protein
MVVCTAVLLGDNSANLGVIIVVFLWIDQRFLAPKLTASGISRKQSGDVQIVLLLGMRLVVFAIGSAALTNHPMQNYVGWLHAGIQHKAGSPLQRISKYVSDPDSS